MPSRRPSVRRSRLASPEVAAEEPRMLSSDEKRELILAHAAARQANPGQNWGIGYYVGIAASCLVVATGWWLTLGTSLRSRLPSKPDQAAQILDEQVQKLKSDWKQAPTQAQAKDSVSETMSIIQQQYQDAVAKQRAQQVSASSSATVK